jgi:hypothetical protein
LKAPKNQSCHHREIHHFAQSHLEMITAKAQFGEHTEWLNGNAHRVPSNKHVLGDHFLAVHRPDINGMIHRCSSQKSIWPDRKPGQMYQICSTWNTSYNILMEWLLKPTTSKKWW